MKNKNGFSRCAEFYIGRLRKEGRHSTAHVSIRVMDKAG